MLKKILIWTIAVIITLGAAVFQRLTGPTYPKKYKVTINNTEYNVKMLRSYGGEKLNDCDVRLEIADQTVSGKVYYRRYPTNDEWIALNLVREKDELIATLPNQPPAGKLEYYIELISQQPVFIAKEKPVVIRFKGFVPNWALIPHIFLMFAAMLISNVTAFLAIFKLKSYKFYTLLSLIVIGVGGMVMGPIVQWFAFGDLWTGVPFGWDLTDNKTLIAFIGWLAAWLVLRKKNWYWLPIAAAVIEFLIFSIPHSMFGSELDPNTGKIIQSMILPWFTF